MSKRKLYVGSPSTFIRGVFRIANNNIAKNELCHKSFRVDIKKHSKSFFFQITSKVMSLNIRLQHNHTKRKKLEAERFPTLNSSSRFY